MVSTAGHGIRGKKAVLISGGSIGVMVSADMKKGIASDSLVSINGGSTILISHNSNTGSRCLRERILLFAVVVVHYDCYL